ncbi:unnamed protein product [Toxocara canis]|uniref:Uncharacterized protein n=1 Tax=Toxocara canis TaxID=6265 RepID=A0A183U0X2_TOXCA|nr:unnamed protein product [Toxocara canis]
MPARKKELLFLTQKLERNQSLHYKENHRLVVEADLVEIKFVARVLEKENQHSAVEVHWAMAVVRVRGQGEE